MKISLPLPCQTCSAHEPVLVSLEGPWWEWECAKCGASNAILSSVNWTKGDRILERATQYRQQGDYSTSIVFSAMALEAEVARLYFKWRRIEHRWTEAPANPFTFRQLTDEELEDEYRSLGRTIAEKLERVARTLDGRGLDRFASESTFEPSIREGFPSLTIGNLAADIQKAVFWRRNRVVHTGFTGHTDDDARSAQSVADVTIALLQAMDLQRQRRGGGRGPEDDAS
jgi:hypothetical protein